MREICIFTLLAILSPWATGIIICLYKFFYEKVEKILRYFSLRKQEKQLCEWLKNKDNWLDIDEVAILKAKMLNIRYERINLFSIDDLKIWKAFI